MAFISFFVHYSINKVFRWIAPTGYQYKINSVSINVMEDEANTITAFLVDRKIEENDVFPEDIFQINTFFSAVCKKGNLYQQVYKSPIITKYLSYFVYPSVPTTTLAFLTIDYDLIPMNEDQAVLEYIRGAVK